MVAFSGTVVDGSKEYTESNMNGVSESQTVETFKGDEYKFMIVAEKLQTGFDQPLLTAMYVDKKLAGVGAVQTLSRLNRSAYSKEQVFVLDFVNTVDDIKASFQPYYTTTVLSEATDPNIIHDLERDVYGFKLFSELEMNGLVEELYAGATPDKINATLDVVVERAKQEKNEEELEEFKSTAMEYVRKYGFISQIVTFQDPQLEKLFIFVKLLIRKIPKRTDTLPYEVLEAADMGSYKVVGTGTSVIEFENKDGELDPMDGGQVMTGGPGEDDALSRIIKDINDRFGTQFTEGDKIILNTLSMKMLQDPVLDGSIMNNSKDSAKIKFNELFQGEMVEVLNSHFDLYKKLDENPELRSYVNERIFEFIVRKKELVAN
jgi:type I restriction enzyme R subunit